MKNKDVSREDKIKARLLYNQQQAQKQGIDFKSYIPYNEGYNRKDSMQTKEIIQFVQDHDEFLITYYAKKYGKIITRRGTWTKPNTDIKGKHQVMNGNDVFFYWDINAEPNKNGNQWRRATNPTRCEVA